MNKIVFAGLLLAIVPSAVTAELIQCAFLQENAKSGRPNQASCSMYPEEVFKTEQYNPKITEHCKSDPVFVIEDIRDVNIDTAKKIVTWTVSYKLADHKKHAMVDFYSGSLDSRKKQAEELVNAENNRHEEYSIINVVEGKTALHYDSQTGKQLPEITEVKEKIVLFGNEKSEYVIFIPEWHGESILTSFNADDRHSWAHVRFGHCRAVPE